MEISKTFQLVAILVSMLLLAECEATSIDSDSTEDGQQATKKQGAGGAIVEINLGPLGIIKAGGGGGGRNNDGSQGGGFGGFSWGDFLNVGGGGGGFKNRDGVSGGSGGGGFFAPRTESSGANGSEAPLFTMGDFLDVRSFGGGAGQTTTSQNNDSKGSGGAGFLGGGGGGGFLSNKDGQSLAGGNGFGLVSLGDFIKVLGGGGGGSIKLDKTNQSRRAIVRRQATNPTTTAPPTTTTTTRRPGISLSITASPGGAGGAGGLLSGLGSGGGTGGLFGGGATQEDIDEILSELGFGSHLAPAVTLDPLAYDLRPKYTKNGEPLTAINTRFKVLKRRIFAMDAQTAKPTK